MQHNRRFWLLAAAACMACLAGSSSFVFAQRGAGRATPPAAGQAAPAAASPAAVVEPLRTASDRPVDIRSIRLNLRVDVQKKTVDGNATIAFRCVRPTRTVSLDAVDFEVQLVKVQAGKEAIGATGECASAVGSKIGASPRHGVRPSN